MIVGPPIPRTAAAQARLVVHVRFHVGVVGPFEIAETATRPRDLALAVRALDATEARLAVTIAVVLKVAVAAPGRPSELADVPTGLRAAKRRLFVTVRLIVALIGLAVAVIMMVVAALQVGAVALGLFSFLAAEFVCSAGTHRRPRLWVAVLAAQRLDQGFDCRLGGRAASGESGRRPASNSPSSERIAWRRAAAKA